MAGLAAEGHRLGGHAVVTYSLLVAYGLLWLWLLIDCIRRKRFYPVFGHRWGTKVFWLITFPFFNPLLTLLYLIFGRLLSPEKRPSVLRSALVFVPAAAIMILSLLPVDLPGSEPVRMKRDRVTGEMRPERPDDGVRLSAHSGVIHATNRLNSSLSSVHFGQTCFSCRRIVIVNRSSHALMGRVGVELQRRLAGLAGLDAIDYYPVGHTMPEGQLSPDLALSLDLAEIKEQKLSFYRAIKAKVNISAGRCLYQVGPGYGDHRTPPVLTFSWGGTLDHQSESKGYELGDAKYKLAADNISQELSKAFLKQIDAWRKKFPPLPDLPPVFYGTYRPAGPFPFLSGEDVRCLLSVTDLFKHNHTVWRFEDEREPAAVLTAIQEQMTSEGWKDMGSDVDSQYAPFLHLRKATKRLVVAPPQHPRVTPQLHAAPGAENSALPPKSRAFLAQYEDLFTDEEYERALTASLDQEAPTDTLLAFAQMYHSALRDRLYSLLEQRPITSPNGYRQLAEHYHSRKQPERARKALLRARALLMTRGDYANLDSQIKNLAKRMGEEALADSPVGREVFVELGFTEAAKGEEPSTYEVGLDEEARLFQESPDGKIRTVMVAVRRNLDSASKTPYELTYVAAEHGSRCWGSSGGSVSADGKWSGSHCAGLMRFFVSIQATQTGPDRFRLKICTIED